MDTLRDLLTSAGIPEKLELLLGEGERAIWGIRVDAEHALLRWEQLTDAGGAFVPVLLGDDLAPHQEARSMDERAPEELLAAAARTPPSPRQWLLAGGLEEAELDAELAELHGPFPPSPAPTEDLELSVGDGPQWIALLPAPASDAPLHLRFGGGDMPAPEEHTALLRAFSTAHGAQLVAATGRELAVAVQRPPATREEALQLATDQALYVGDLLGAQTLEELAARLLVDRVWHFRWDGDSADD